MLDAGAELRVGHNVRMPAEYRPPAPDRPAERDHGRRRMSAGEIVVAACDHVGAASCSGPCHSSSLQNRAAYTAQLCRGCGLTRRALTSSSVTRKPGRKDCVFLIKPENWQPGMA